MTERKSYTNGKYLNSHFDSTRQIKREGIGRDCTKEFWEQLGFTVEENDIDENGDMDYTASDFYGYNQDIKLSIEAETKAVALWKYIKEGLDIPARKLKYLDSAKKNGRKFVHTMVRGDGNEILITNQEYFELARDYPYTKNVDREFKVPEHGCYIIRKKCNRYDGRIEYNDFIRIPYKYLKHMKKQNGKWIKK